MQCLNVNLVLLKSTTPPSVHVSPSPQVWKLAGHGLMHSFSAEHAKQSIFRNIGAGVMQVETRPGNRIFTCGADGTLKMRVLPDRYSIPSSLVDLL